ncbi:UTP--glucose-1-phosphate uridylyltransferase [Sphingomonas carotinifaciens]|uniref:UTP--glucose-1-phosphate uridylyltransferase n=1 Tax=Sphingomonas carotinifaciens TaxID=1166323 RepID=A0A1G7G5M0_9SPHN|nr:MULTISPECIES: UTP--glucose-1-phosphate uridylyltransferase [Sphingomonas]MBB4086395.1 UTP--glucose-1-phosphate uridylyltransferase [Sphingomonas carotinifaciens]MWC42715.1 NTP transferase domain-containing protein [Sphingomonas carotinifaciens]SDE83432.1 UTP--glucose-1-phosphate uridylyltransferase [Sphingomonas carotinifaciens]
MRKLRKAVFPIGGMGTRFLPATKSMPKEMLPVVDRPLIQYAVDEAREAGIEQFIFVTSRGKGMIEDHFDHAFELEETMSRRGKSLGVLDDTRISPGDITVIRQQEPLGLGHAVWCARRVVGDEPFAVLLPDDLMVGRPGCLKQMVEAYNERGGNLICTEEVAPQDTAKYGIVTPGERFGAVTEVKGLVEKPAPADAPSNLGVIGRYILQPEVMDILAGQEEGAGGEIQLTDALARLIGQQAFHGVTFRGTRYDCGDKAGFVTATIALALQRPDIAPAVRAFMATAA